jgi:hypothetical protein
MDDHTVVGGAGTIVDGVASAAGPLSLAALTRRTGIAKPSVRPIANDFSERAMLDLTSDRYLAASELINQRLPSAHHSGTALIAQSLGVGPSSPHTGQFASFATVNNRDLTMTASACGRSHARGRTLLTRHIDVRGVGRALRKFAESLAAELMPPPATGASQDHGIERPPGAHRHAGRD